MKSPLTDDYLDLLRSIGFQRPTQPSGLHWLPKTETEIDLLRQAQALEAARTNLLAEVDRLRAERHTTNEALSDVAEQLRANRDRLAELELYAPTGFDPVEDIEYEVVGDWGVDGAVSADAAIAFVRKALQDYPHCGARAQQRTVRTWDDDSQWYGPWTDLPLPDNAAQQEEKPLRPGVQRLNERAATEGEATHWRRLGMTPPPRQAEDPHDHFLHQRFETCRDLPTTPTAIP
ncbi:hypothetical protein [Streptomyces sp. NPDC056169]|uniref:hypothetical protein n=1 Tax=Streptomyces sp. NPDC056169 TaxID=3345734 RepID=UPI0035E31ED5